MKTFSKKSRKKQALQITKDYLDNGKLVVESTLKETLLSELNNDGVISTDIFDPVIIQIKPGLYQDWLKFCDDTSKCIKIEKIMRLKMKNYTISDGYSKLEIKE